MVGENGSHWAILEIAEHGAPGNTITLWPRIAAQLAKRSQKTVGPKLFQGRVRLAVGLGLLLLLVGSLIFVPAVRAFTESIIQRLGIAFVDTEQFGPTSEVGHPTASMVTPPSTLTIREFQERITFPLLTPTWLPEGLAHVYRSMQDMQAGQVVDIQYCRTQDLAIQNGCVILHAGYKAQSAPPLLAESKEQTVEINGQPGIYVHGGWEDNGKGDPNTRLGNLLWDDQADDAYLTWMQNDVTYLLEAHNLGLGLDEMKRIAESMQEK